MVAVPAEMPDTMPDDEPTMARAVLELLHVPPPDASVSRLVTPTQATLLPEIGKTRFMTLIGAVA